MVIVIDYNSGEVLQQSTKNAQKETAIEINTESLELGLQTVETESQQSAKNSVPFIEDIDAFLAIQD